MMEKRELLNAIIICQCQISDLINSACFVLI